VEPYGHQDTQPFVRKVVFKKADRYSKGQLFVQGAIDYDTGTPTLRTLVTDDGVDGDAARWLLPPRTDQEAQSLISARR